MKGIRKLLHRPRWQIAALLLAVGAGGVALAKELQAEQEIDFCQAVGCLSGSYTCFYYKYGVPHSCPKTD